MSAEITPLWPLRVTILGLAPLWTVVASLGPRVHPQMERLLTIWPTLPEAQAAARRLAAMLGGLDIVFLPYVDQTSDGGSAA